MPVAEASSGREPDAPCVDLQGDVDMATVPAWKRTALAVIADGADSRVTLDLSGVAFIDSTGLGLLIDLRNAAADAGRELLIVNVPHHVRRLFEITGLVRILVEAD